MTGTHPVARKPPRKGPFGPSYRASGPWGGKTAPKAGNFM